MILSQITAAPSRRRHWLRRAGLLGFWFFLVKGLLWLAAPFVFYFAL
jgi:hypothetical protein